MMYRHSCGISFIAAAVALSACVALTGCGSSSANKTKISFFSYFSKSQIGNTVAAFEKKYPDIQIDMSTAPNPAQYVQTLQTRLAGGKPPTVFNITMDNRGDVLKSGAAEPLDGKSFLQGIDKQNFSLFTYGGKTLAMPVSAWFSGMFYNKKIVASVGYKKFPSTWDDFIVMCQKINKTGKTGYLEDFNSQPAPSLAGLIGSSYGKRGITDPDQSIWNGKTTFSSEWKQPLKEWEKGIHGGVIQKKSIGLSGDQIKNEFITGNLAVYRSGPWDVSDLNKSNIDWAAAPMPAIKGAKPWITGGPDQGFAIASHTDAKEKAAAEKFLAFLNSKEGLKTFTTDAGTISLSHKYTSKPVAKLAGLVKELKAGHYYWYNWGKSPTVMSTLMISEQQQLVQGKITPSQLLSALDTKWRTLK